MDASLHPWFGRSKTTSIPQAKGRIERLFQTLQSRLPIELRLAGISNLGQTNEFLASCLKEFNTQFALDMGCTRSVLKNKMNRDVGLISTKGQLQSSSEHFPISSMCMPWQVKKSRRPADHIPEMFMPRKAFDNELRHERLICREAKVICCCLPPPRLMSQEPRCQMHRGITFH